MKSGEGSDARTARLLIESVSGTIEVIARKLASKVGHAWFEQLVQAGYVGAGEAARSYDRRRGTAFEGYAWPRIAGAMIDMLRKEGARLPPGERLALEHASAALGATSDFVAELQDKSPDDVDGEMEGAAGLAFADRRGQAEPSQDPEAALLEEEGRALVLRAVAYLPEREQELVNLHAFEGRTFEQMAERLGIDAQTLRKRHRTAMKRLGAILRPLLLGSGRPRR
jgi:RNA polymerase sigma factor for flagellar operon FliA